MRGTQASLPLTPGSPTGARPLDGNSTPLQRIAGYRAPLPPRLARPYRAYLAHLAYLATPPPSAAARGRARQIIWRRGWDLNPRDGLTRLRALQARRISRSRTPPRPTDRKLCSCGPGLRRRAPDPRAGRRNSWRKGWDSNPRGGRHPPTRFRVGRLRPAQPPFRYNLCACPRPAYPWRLARYSPRRRPKKRRISSAHSGSSTPRVTSTR